MTNERLGLLLRNHLRRYLQGCLFNKMLTMTIKSQQSLNLPTQFFIPSTNLLQKRGSLYVTRPTLQDFIRERRDLETGSSELFDLVQRGRVRIEVNQTYALRDAAQAHRDLEARQTTGSVILVP